MSTKHTPGPWTTVKRYQDKVDVLHTQPLKIGAASSVVARVTVRDSWLEEQTANARLIAAAPELFEGLRFMQMLYECDLKEVDREKVEWIREILAKVAGEAS